MKCNIYLGPLVFTILLSVFSFSGCSSSKVAHSNGSFIDIEQGQKIYYQESGKGQGLVFIPGFAFGGDIFSGQLEYFSKSYRSVAIDPRSQGYSTVNSSGNNYRQHGSDLAKVLQNLSMEKPILIGWSNGCRTVWEYFREFGTENTKAFVCIDGAPVIGIDCDEDWYKCKVDRIRRLIKSLESGNRLDWTRKFTQWMMKRDLSPNELNWLVSNQLQTPDAVALELAKSMLFDDYRKDLISVSQELPILYLLQLQRSEKMRDWLKENAPNVKVNVIDNHLSFWEKPNYVNELIERFLVK